MITDSVGPLSLISCVAPRLKEGARIWGRRGILASVITALRVLLKANAVVVGNSNAPDAVLARISGRMVCRGQMVLPRGSASKQIQWRNSTHPRVYFRGGKFDYQYVGFLIGPYSDEGPVRLGGEFSYRVVGKGPC